MTLVILVVSMLLIGLAVWLDNESREILSTLSGALGAIGAVVAIVIAIVCTLNLLGIQTIDDRIAMYEEENTRIEEQIANIVENYQQYETDIFLEVAPEDAVTMISLYPELKSDTLVQAQIETHIANNTKIKELKNKEITASAYRWWLYFGK